MTFSCTPLEHSAGFGASISGLDLNDLSEADFLKLQTALYTHRLLVVKDQRGLLPTNQAALNLRFDPSAPGTHGDGGSSAEKRKEVSAIRNGTFQTDLPDAHNVRIVGKGVVPAGHFGIVEEQNLPGGSHVGFHETPLTKEQLNAGETRLWRWHIDAPLYPKNCNTARVTTLFAHTLPKGPDLTVRWDDGSDKSPMKCRPGTTAFICGQNMFESFTDEQKALVENSFVEYYPKPYFVTSACKGRNDGFALLSEGHEIPEEDWPDDALDEEAQILPMCWPNAMFPGKKAFQVHAIAARRLHLRTSAGGEVRVVDDIAEVRKILDDLQRPFLTEKNIIFAPYEEGDIAIWLNRALRHTAIEYPISYGRRTCHQCHLGASDPVDNPTKLTAVEI